MKPSKKLTSGERKFLNLLLTQLSEWEDVSDIFLNEKLLTEKKDLMEIDINNENMKVDKENNLLNSLIYFVFSEIYEVIEKNLMISQCSPLFSPSLKLLLLIQREIVNNSSYHHFLFSYACNLITKSKKLIEYIFQFQNSIGEEKLDNILQSSILGIVFRSFIISLSRKTFTLDKNFVIKLLPYWMDILKSLDKLNNNLSKVKQADHQYLINLTNKKEKSYIVESKHPYPSGKNQIKQTVTITGAEALCLNFDSKCKTPNSDTLQLFKSNGPIMGKEDKPLIFYGNNWPKQNIIISGDSVTFIFNTNSYESNKNIESRWGFRCRFIHFTYIK